MSGGTPATVVLDRARVSYTLHPYVVDNRDNRDNRASYGEEAAAQLGVDPRRMFKTLIAAVDNRLVCAGVPVASRLNLKALASAAGGRRADMADPAKAQRATGYVVGGISPLGTRARCRYWSTPRPPASTRSTSRPASAGCSWSWRRPTCCGCPAPAPRRSPPPDPWAP